MSNYLATIDLAEEESWKNVINIPDDCHFRYYHGY
jgi:hypothetical protein